MGTILVSLPRLGVQLGRTGERKYIKSSPKLGEPTLEVRAEDKLFYTMPYEEEEDRGCEVKCPKGGGGCGNGVTVYSA